MVRVFSIFALVLTVGVISGCTSYKQFTQPQVNIIEKSHEATDALVAGLNGRIRPDTPIVVASIADINEIETSSPLGRTISEHIITRLVQLGFTNVSEIRLRRSLYLREKDQAASGEFLLSRDARAVAETRSAGVIVTGTYTAGEFEISTSLRMVEVKTGDILSSHDYTMPINAHTEGLLMGNAYDANEGFSIFNSRESLY